MSSGSDVEAGKTASDKNAKQKEADLYEARQNVQQSFFDSKMFRLISVIVYVCLVSGLGFLFALYHLFFWDSTMPPVPIVHGHEAY